MPRFRYAAIAFLPWVWLNCACASARSNHQIVFAAQFYKRVANENLQPLSSFHLYLIHADGSRRKRLTYGQQDDYAPTWSPDGRRVLFARYRKDGEIGICSIDSTGGEVTTLAVLDSQNSLENIRYEWSPDGRKVAVSEGEFFERPSRRKLHLIEVATRRKRTFPQVLDFAWAPDGARMYISCETGSDKIIADDGRKMVAVAAPVWNPVWIDSKRVMGVLRSGLDATDYTSYDLRVINQQGKEQRRVRLRMAKSPGDRGLGQWLETTRWHRLGNRKFHILYEHKWHMSDGTHQQCYLLDIRTGRLLYLRNSAVAGISPDGRQFAAAEHEWVGPYKRGGERVGALKIVSLKTGKTRSITPGLVSIAGGDWRDSK